VGCSILFCASQAASFSISLVHPLETVRTRMQGTIFMAVVDPH
jgi:hypothetical protein